MRLDPGSFPWNEKKEDAAILVSEGEKTEAEIAEKLKISRRLLVYWKQHPDFNARVDEHIEAFRRAAMRFPIAQVGRRVGFLQDRHNRMRSVIEERAEALADRCPGGASGLMVRDVKSVGSGPGAEIVELFKVDAGLLSEMREHEKQAAQELGQWTERKDLTTGGKPFLILEWPDAGSTDQTPPDG